MRLVNVRRVPMAEEERAAAVAAVAALLAFVRPAGSDARSQRSTEGR